MARARKTEPYSTRRRAAGRELTYRQIVLAEDTSNVDIVMIVGIRKGLGKPVGGRRMLAAVWLVVSLLMAALCARLGAQTLSEEVPIPGGTAALSRALGLDPPPDRARFLTELTRVIYGMPEGTRAETDVLLQKLAQHSEAIGRFQSALAAVRTREGTIALSMASRTDERNRLKDFLELIGLTLREKNNKYTVERTDNKPAAERPELLANLGVDLGQLSALLNGGEAAHIEVPTETVPIPLPARVWSESVFRRAVDVGDLFSAVVGNRQAALLCYGLAALDDETLQFLVERPTIITHLYGHEAGTFAAFAGGLRIRHGNISVPGGELARDIWEAVVDEKLSRPDRFILELFSRRSGRVAYLYDSLTHLDAPTVAFALGLWIKDAGLRVERAKSLLASLEPFPGWSVPERPFGRPSDDPVGILTRVAVDESGAPRGPSWRTLWSRAFDGIDLPSDPARQLKDMRENGLIDAAGLTEAVLATESRFRSERLDQIGFGQRVFADADDRVLPDVLVALRAFPRYRMLMLTLDRMGIRDPAVYAAAARHAERLSMLDPTQAFSALSQFQGSVAILFRLVRSEALEPDRAAALVTSLSATRLDGDGRYLGAIARWVRDSLIPAIEANVGDIDAVLVQSLAGSRRRVEAKPAPVLWENRAYRLDVATPEAHRLTRVLQKLGAGPVSRALVAEAIAERLNAPDVTLADIQTSNDQLKQLATSFKPPRKEKNAVRATLPSGVNPAKNPREVVNKASQVLATIKPKEVRKALHVAESLFELVDDLLVEALLSLTYALELGDPEGMTLLAGNVSRRHDFGFGERVAEVRARKPWTQPTQEIQPGVPWHVTGSLLGLDLGLSTLTLRRISADSLSEAPTLSLAEKDTFSRTVALVNPFALRDADRDVIAEAIARGRERIARLPLDNGAFDALADEIVMDGWRRRAARWALVNDAEHVASFFSTTDLLYLGKPQASAALDAWGMAADAYDGCLCTELPRPGRWSIVVGRQRVGVLSTQVADLNLRIAQALHELRLPAALAKGVLAAATQDYVDRVKPLHRDDWLTLVRTAQRIPIDRIEDYVAALTVNGPLVPDAAPSGAGQSQ